MQVVGFGNASFASGAAGAAPGRPSYAIAGPTVDGGMTVEERLERVERILEDLQVRDGKRNKFTYVNPKAATTGAEGSAGGTHGFSYNMETPPKRDFDQAERAIEQARREVEAAHRAQEMATKEKAFQDSSNNFERLKNEFRLKAVGAKQNELEALRTARQSLQAEVNKLERQIKRMEEDQKRANDPGANDGPRIKSLPQDAQPGLQTR